MKNSIFRLALLIGLVTAMGLVIAGCGDDDDNNPTSNPTTITSYDDVHGWDCALGEDCQDVFDIEFAAGAIVDFSATETTGGSVLQIALYAPDKGLGDVNLFTGDTDELRCGFISGCSENTAGQTFTGFVIPAAGTYRLAITRDWGNSCGGEGTYRLLIDADTGFSQPSQTVDDVASLASGWDCPYEVGTLYDEVHGWDCDIGIACQDVFDVEFAASTTVTLEAIDTTGGSVLQIALYAPGTALGGTNMLTASTDELRCNFVSGCNSNTAGQTVNNYLIPAAGTYRFAVTRDWGNSCGGSGTYRLRLTADRPIIILEQTVDDEETAASGWSCPS